MATFKDYALLSEKVYKDPVESSGWKPRSEYTRSYSESGFFGAVYENDSEVVIAYRGTDTNREMGSDLKFLEFDLEPSDRIAQQFLQALDLSSDVQSDPTLNGKPISITGHSLGGALAEIAGAYSGLTTITFGSPGSRRYLDDFGAVRANNAPYDVMNFVFDGDPVGDWFGLKRHLGTTALLKDPDPTEQFPDTPVPYEHSMSIYREKIEGSELAKLRADVIFANHDTFMNAAGDLLVSIDPLILDLDDDGIETTNVKGGAHFDHDGSGFAEQTGWVGPDDGLLVWDRNGDGVIDDGKELFGDQTILKDGTLAANGFQALAELDGNADGAVDANDAGYDGLAVWRDIDGDGVSSPAELSSLADLGIAALRTEYLDSGVIDSQGNTQAQLGSFTWADGTIGQMGDYLFQRDTLYSVAKEQLEVPADIAALPDIKGYGDVYDLHQAMVRDENGNLKDLVEAFGTEGDPAERGDILKDILFKWTGSDSLDPASRGSYIDARLLGVMEQFFGQEFADGANPDETQSTRLKQSYAGLSELIYADLMAQTHLKDLYGLIGYDKDEAGGQVKGDLSDVTVALDSLLVQDPLGGKDLLGEFARTLRGYQAESVVDYWDFRSQFASGNEELAWAFDSAGRTIIQGSQGDDSLLVGTPFADAIRGGDGNDFIPGSEGDDVLYGQAGADALWGERGNDLLIGGAGNDTYRFGRGSGQDVISNYDPIAGNLDTIEMEEGVLPNDVMVARDGHDLVLSITGTEDQLTVQNFADPDYTVERVIFGDGTVWSSETLQQRAIDAQVDQLVQAMAGFTPTSGLSSEPFIEDRTAEVQTLLVEPWETRSGVQI